MLTIACPQLLDDGRFDGPVAVSVDAGRVVAVERRPSRPGDLVLDDGVLTAGMCDLQVNGAGGVDLSTAGYDGWSAVAELLVRHGVTSFCATTITAPLGTVARLVAQGAAARERLADRAVAQPAGLHLEGPFLSPDRAGAHPPELMRAPTPEALDALLDAPHSDEIAIVTLAPELPGAPEAIARLRAAGITVSIGHSDATAAQTRAAADAGATLVTHLFNAQRPFTHREPGVAGRALVDDRLALGLIADLHHVAPDAVRLAFRAAAGRVALVSDAMAAAGMRSGTFRHGPIEVIAHEDGPPTLPDGTLAGSALFLDEAVRNVVSVGVAPATALDAATRVPARAIGRSGRIAAGERADIVWWDEQLNVRGVWVAGEAVSA